MTKKASDNLLYFYHVTMNKWKESALAILPPNTGAELSIERPTTSILKECAIELGMTVEELVDGAYEFRRGNVTRRFAGSGSLENNFTVWLCGNKYATFELLKKHDYRRVPYHRRYSLSTIEEARQDFVMRDRPVVIKPSNRTSGGAGVTVNIRSIKQLNRAIFRSLRYDSNYLLEDFIEGDNFRILMFKDRMISAVHRIPANVKGDGMNDIKHLIRVENVRRTADKGFGLEPISIDRDVRQTLLDQKISLNHVPAKGETVYLRRVCNRHIGGEWRDVTSIVHPDVIQYCGSIMRLMNITLGGIDVIAKSIERPLSQTGGVINEVNIGPGLRIHEKAAVMDLLDLAFEEGPAV